MLIVYTVSNGLCADSLPPPRCVLILKVGLQLFSPKFHLPP